MLPKNKKLPPKRDGGRPIVTGGPRPPITDIKNHLNVDKGPKIGKGVQASAGPKKDNKGPGNGGKMFGARGGYEGVSKRKVNRLTNGVIREEVKGLRGQRRELKADSRQQARGVRRDYQRGVGDLQHVHGETQDYLNNLAGRTQQMYGDQQSQQATATAALQSMLGQTYSGAQNGAQNELSRLGIEGGGNMTGMIADQANAQGVAMQSGANAQSTMGMAGANSQAAMQMLQGMNQGSMMQGMGQNLNARNDAMGEIRTNRADGMNQVRHAIQDARGSRKDVFFQMLQQLQQTGWDQYVQQQQLGMQRKALKKN